DRNERGNEHGSVDGNVIDQICQQQVKGEECGGQEEVVHGMQIDVAHSGDNEHQEKEKEQGDGGKVTDLSRQRAWLKFFRHGHADLKAGDQIIITPGEIPALGRKLFG